MSNPDFEALVTPKIAEALQAAIEKVGRSEFETISGVKDEQLSSILSNELEYIPVALVTVACQVNKAHNDPNLNHSSVTECLKGSTIRIPPLPGHYAAAISQPSARRRKLTKLKPTSNNTGPLYDTKSTKVAGFVANIATFLILGYFLGGIGISPLIGEQSCIGVTTSPVALSPCGGSLVGLVVSAIGGIAYTFYYFVKKL